MASAGSAWRDPAPGPGAGARPLAVLLVDDDGLVRMAVGALLQAMGHAVTALAGGEEALAWLKEGLPLDVIILDMNMPGMNGAATLPWVRALHPDTPVLLTTGEPREEVSALLAAFPGVQALYKPFGIEELAAMLPAGLNELPGMPSRK